MIRVAIQRKAFGDLEVLSDVDFGMAGGERLAVLGPSGVGKSTLLRLIAGLDDDFEGAILCPERIGFVFQEPVLLPWRSAVDNLVLVHPQLSRAEALRWLERVGIAERADAFPRQLSLGQQRRLALARAFAGAPDLLVMDEPYVSLDAATAGEMIALTAGLLAETGPALILVTHAGGEAEALGCRVLRLEGRPATVFG